MYTWGLHLIVVRICLTDRASAAATFSLGAIPRSL
jgi:hypothetical protein